MTDDTSRSPSLGGEQREGPTGREPGLPRLHQQRYEEMTIDELIGMMTTKQHLLFTCDAINEIFHLTEDHGDNYNKIIDVLHKRACGKRSSYEGEVLGNSRLATRSNVDEAKLRLAWSIILALSEEKRTKAAASLACSSLGLTALWSDSIVTWQKARAIEYLTGHAE